MYIFVQISLQNLQISEQCVEQKRFILFYEKVTLYEHEKVLI